MRPKEIVARKRRIDPAGLPDPAGPHGAPTYLRSHRQRTVVGRNPLDYLTAGDLLAAAAALPALLLAAQPVAWFLMDAGLL